MRGVPRCSAVSHGLVRLEPFHYRLGLRLSRDTSDDPIDLRVICNRFENFPTPTFDGWRLDVEFRLRHDGMQPVTDALAGRALDSYNAILGQGVDHNVMSSTPT